MLVIFAVFTAIALVWSLRHPAAAAQIPLFSLQVSPEVPTAGQRVTVSVVPQNFTATSTNFVWFRDDVKLASASGSGRAALIINTSPDDPELIRVKVSVGGLPDFEPTEQTITIYTLPNIAREEERIADIGSDYTLKVSNQSPEPGETVNFEVVTFAFDRAASSYQWFVNSVEQRTAAGRGQYAFALVAGSEGQRKTVEVSVTLPNGKIRSKNVAIQSGHIALYWWTDTQAPYWYKGKALPALGGHVRAMALVNGRDGSPLNYLWNFNDSVATPSSGVGKSTYDFPLNFPVAEKIEIQLSDLSGDFRKTKSFSVTPGLPEAAVYETRAGRGVIFEKRLGRVDAEAGEILNFTAFPFFFTSDKLPDLNYSWMINGQKIAGIFTKPWKFTLKSNPGEFSQNSLNVEISEPAKNGRRASAALQINFR